MRILVTARWLGGAGGVERLVYSLMSALADEDVTLVVEQRLDGPWSLIPASIRVRSSKSLRWRGSHTDNPVLRGIVRRWVDPVRRRLNPAYDVHIACFHGPHITRATRAGLTLLYPAGNDVRPYLGDYAQVAMEAPDNQRFVPAGLPSCLLPPPLLPLPDPVPIDRPLPQDYFLTVFNPYHPMKGADDLLEALATSPLPVVWCHSRRTVDYELHPALASHPKLIHVEDPSPAQMRHLYEGCRAYLAFSRSEGFGWAAADALRYSPIIVTRPVGVFSFPQAAALIRPVLGPSWQVDWESLVPTPAERAPRDLGWLSGQAYLARLNGLLSADRTATAPAG